VAKLRKKEKKTKSTTATSRGQTPTSSNFVETAARSAKVSSLVAYG
jgi:hypothetical protein